MSFTLSQTPDSVNLYLYPNGDVSGSVGLSTHGTSDHWDCVDEIWYSPNDDTNYVYGDGTLEVSDWYSLPNHTSESGTINYVRVISQSKSHYAAQHNSGVFKLLVNDGGTYEASANQAPLNISYNKYYGTWATKPSGGAWTWSDIDAMTIGVRCNSPDISVSNTTITLWPESLNNSNNCSAVPATKTHVTSVNNTSESSYNKISSDLGGYAKFNMYDTDFDYDTINNVTGYMKVKHGSTSLRKNAGMEIYPVSTGYEVLSGDVTSSWDLKSYVWATNPETSAAWTGSEIDATKLRWESSGATGQRDVYCCSLYFTVNFLPNANPPIRTTQCYAVVNYTPAASTVTLEGASHVDVSHSRSIKRKTFPDGEYVVNDYGRGGKTLQLTGTQISDGSAKMQDIKDMCHYGTKVTISGLDDTNLNTDYMIRDFNFSEDAGSASRIYKWALSLEEY